jgi:hypothetical protein
VNLKEELLAVVQTLNHAAVPYALCGGLAVVLHGYPRLTRDIDLLIRPEDLPAARAALATAGFTIDAGTIPFGVGGPHEREVCRISKAAGPELLTLDLLLLPSFLGEIWESRETYEVEGTRIDVVSRSGLIRMKKIAGRPQDLGDVAALEGDAT